MGQNRDMFKKITIVYWGWERLFTRLFSEKVAKRQSPFRKVWRLLLTGATVTGCLATVASFFGRFGWPLELSSHFRWHYFLSLTAMALVFGLGRQYKQALVAITFALVNLIPVAPFYWATVPPVETGQTYRALMLNVLYLNDTYQEVQALVHKTEPDFVVLVEVSQEWRQALQSLHADYPYSHYTAIAGQHGTVLYSRIPFTAADTQVIEDEERPSVVVNLNLDGPRLTVIGTHPSSPLRPTHTAARNRQMNGLAHFISKQSGPIMVLGDLNITPWSPVFQDFLQTTGLRSGRKGFGIQPSWPASLSVLGIPIDHALVSPQVIVHNFETGPYVGSDHYPIIVDFSLSRARQTAQSSHP